MTPLKKVTIAAFIALFITGCSSTAITPQGGSIYTVTQLAPSDVKANYNAMSKAQDVCAAQDGKPKILDQETAYQGLDSNQQSLVDYAGRILPKSDATSGFAPENRRYKTTLTFSCE